MNDTPAPNEMPDEIWANATSFDNRGLIIAFGEWIDGKEPSDPFNTRYIRADLRAPVSARGEALEIWKKAVEKAAGTYSEYLEFTNAETMKIESALQQPPVPAVDLEKLVRNTAIALGKFPDDVREVIDHLAASGHIVTGKV